MFFMISVTNEKVFPSAYGTVTSPDSYIRPRFKILKIHSFKSMMRKDLFRNDFRREIHHCYKRRKLLSIGLILVIYRYS